MPSAPDRSAEDGLREPGAPDGQDEGRSGRHRQRVRFPSPCLFLCPPANTADSPLNDPQQLCHRRRLLRVVHARPGRAPAPHQDVRRLVFGLLLTRPPSAHASSRASRLTGVLEVGLFVGMAEAAYFGYPDGTVLARWQDGAHPRSPLVFRGGLTSSSAHREETEGRRDKGARDCRAGQEGLRGVLRCDGDRRASCVCTGAKERLTLVSERESQCYFYPLVVKRDERSVSPRRRLAAPGAQACRAGDVDLRLLASTAQRRGEARDLPASRSAPGVHPRKLTARQHVAGRTRYRDARSGGRE